MDKKYGIGFLGYGNMAKSIIDGILRKTHNKSDIFVYAPSIKNLEKVDGISVANSEEDLFKNSNIIILAVKPQIYRNELKNKIANIDSKIVISIMAGVSSKEIKNIIQNEKVSVYRTMPNTPCMISSGLTAIEKIKNKEEKAEVHKIFKTLGHIIEIDDDKFDLVSAITGSGPAYIEYFIKNIVDFAVDNGIPYKTARKMVVQTVKGTAKLIESKSDTYIDDMISSVCSEGGMTIAGLKYLENRDFDIILKNSIKEAKERSEELSKDE